MSWNELIVDYGVFLSSFNVKPNGAMLLVGSGISVQSGIPTGGQLVWEFKGKYSVEKRALRDSFSDLSLQKNQVKLQAYFDSKGEYPKLYAQKSIHFIFKNVIRWQAIENCLSRILLKTKTILGHLCLGVWHNRKSYRYMDY